MPFDPRRCGRVLKGTGEKTREIIEDGLSECVLRCTLKLQRCSITPVVWREDSTMPYGCVGTKKHPRVSYLSHGRGSCFFLCCPSDASLRTCLCLWLTLYPYLLASTLHSSPLPSSSSFLDSQSFCPLFRLPSDKVFATSLLCHAFCQRSSSLFVSRSSPLCAWLQASSLKSSLLAECWCSVKEERWRGKQRGWRRNGRRTLARRTCTRVAVSLCGGECHTLKRRRENG